MLLGEFLADELKKRNITDLHVDKRVLRKLVESKVDYLQWLAVLLLQGRAKICIGEDKDGDVIYERLGVRLLHGRGNVISRFYAKWKDSECITELEDIYKSLRNYVINLRKKLLFIIDLSFWNEHTEIEKKELIEQVIMCIKLIRSYLYDTCLVLTSCCEDFLQYFNKLNRNMYHEVEMTSLDLRKYLKNIIKHHRIAMLDPEGDHVLTEVDARSYTAYIIGGIIDKERVDKYGTYRLYNLYRLYELNIPRFKICLDCSTIGVPDRINRIVEIIIKCVLYRKSIRDAILEAQSKKDRIYRWYYEIQKNSKKVVKDGKVVKHLVSRDLLNKLMSLYPISDKDVSRIFRSLNVEVVD
ncbi:MAG: hypothetical protein GXO26_00215 [Crenarchaeota archaeon]|nr:hypothetical protein [Thermoproteota archaeon]